MTTYAHMLKVSQNAELTNSQKFHELFKDAKTDPASVWIEKFEGFSDPMPSSFPEDAQVVAFDGQGQILVVRFNDNSYHSVDFGLGDSQGNTLVEALDDYDQEIMDQIWDSYLNTEDSPLAFYEGGFIDHDLESSFLDSFPDQD